MAAKKTCSVCGRDPRHCACWGTSLTEEEYLWGEEGALVSYDEASAEEDGEPEGWGEISGGWEEAPVEDGGDDDRGTRSGAPSPEPRR